MGFAGRPDTAASKAVSSPATNASGTWASRHSTRSRRSATAAWRTASSTRALRATATTISRAPTADAAATRTVEHEVRDGAYERLVLPARRLPLGAVHDHDGPAAGSSDRAQLLAGRKAAPAPAPQAARDRDVDQPLPEREPAVAPQVLLVGARTAVGPGAGEQAARAFGRRSFRDAQRGHHSVGTLDAVTVPPTVCACRSMTSRQTSCA